MSDGRRAFSTSALLGSGLLLVLCAALVGCAHAERGGEAGNGIRFISDDFSAALARARSEGKPLFVDAWAPWCHSCVSMKTYVFPDGALSPVADRFVWLEIDTEKPANRAFLEQFPSEALPTLMVIDPRTGQAFRRWVGSATVVELAARLRATALAITPGAPGTPAQSALARASAADATGDHAGATEAYRQALAASVPRSLDHAQAVEGLVQRLAQDGDPAGCVELAREELSHVAPGTALATLVATGLSCALELDEDDGRRVAALGALESRVANLARDPSVLLMADDRSSLFESEEGARRARGDLAGARATAVRWTAFLEEEAAHAETAEARAVFDSHRLSAYLALGEPERAVTMLEQSARDFPNDYNPPARLAVAYLAMREPWKALEHARRASSLVYGPRTLRVLLLRAEAEARVGDAHAARVTLARAEKLVNELPPAQFHASMSIAIAAKRKALFEPPTALRR
ncbi:MAG TPA: thioredoxin family protein [Myxococcaceae bacterium]|nr:thioredoxin family protein [Myxococcaceae bacterium]